MYTLGKTAKKTYNAYKARARAKINRLKKKGFDVTGIIDFSLDKTPNFETKKEYFAWKKKIDKFTDRNNYDYKPKTSKTGFEYLPAERKALLKRTKKAIERANERLTEIANKPIINKDGTSTMTIGEEQSVLKEPMKQYMRIPSELDVDDLPSRKVFEKRLKQMQNRDRDDFFSERDEESRKNFIEILRTTHGEDADGVIRELSKLPIDDFVDFYYQHGEFRHNWWYKTIESIEHLGELEQTIINYSKKVNDLKQFR